MNAKAFYHNHIVGNEFCNGIAQFSNMLSYLQYQAVYRVANKYLAPAQHVLDWGCGNGHFSYFLRSQDIKTTSYSIIEEPAFSGPPFDREFEFVIAKDRGDGIDPVALPFENDVFDCVFSIGVLEHVHEGGGDEIKSMLEIQRILKPGGLFLCFHFPNKFGWIEYVLRTIGKDVHLHKRRYSKSEIKKYCHESGFELTKCGRYNFLPRNQMARLPGFFRKNGVGISMVQAVDRMFSITLPVLCTNWYFVVQKEPQ